MFPKTPILDTFDRADESPIGGNWTNNALAEGANNQLKVSSNTLMAVTAGTSCEAFWNPTLYSGYTEVYFTVVSKVGNGQRFEVGFLQNAGLSSYQGYQCLFIDNAGTDTITLQRIDQTAIATVLATTNVEFNVGDVLGASMRARGGVIIWQNGVAVLSSDDATYVGGVNIYVGIRDTVGAVDNFGGGNIQTGSMLSMFQ